MAAGYTEQAPEAASTGVAPGAIYREESATVAWLSVGACSVDFDPWKGGVTYDSSSRNGHRTTGPYLDSGPGGGGGVCRVGVLQARAAEAARRRAGMDRPPRG